MSALESVDADLYDEDGRPVSPSGEQHTGQVRMAYRLARAHRGQLLHVHGIGWHRWDGQRWARDDGEVMATQAVLDVLRDARAEAFQDKELLAAAVKCESANGIKGVLAIAEALVEFATTIRDVDADPWLLNCANGTLDLRTRQLRAHDPADRITKVTTGGYRPDADTTEWDRFLTTVLPDPDVRSYLQRVAGQCAPGLVREHLFPVLTGTGANGKGTWYGAVTHAMGDYATVINPELLMARDRGGVGGEETMVLRGARLVIGSETEEGRRLDQATMKRLTGGDEITARHHYKPMVSWHPTHQLVYVTNDLPKVKGNDAAVWRRMRVVPFDVVVPVPDRDVELAERLRLHADAVLSWLVAGWFDYLDAGGMREPVSVLGATARYQQESDAVARFVADRCVTGVPAHDEALTGALHDAFTRWAQAEQEDQLSARKFGQELDRLGHPTRKAAGGRRVRTGLGIAPDGDL